MRDLLIVFSNWNGMRTCNDYTIPRIQACLDSFLKYYPDKPDALLLDNNSSDGSVDLLESYVSDSWVIRKKNKEDFYLGTLFYLAKEFASQYKYLMLVDNDQYFIRGNFLETAISIMNYKDNIVCFRLSEPTIADALDHHRQPKMIVTVSDFVGFWKNDIYMLSARFSGKEKWFQPTREEKGYGIISIRGLPSKRACWLSYDYLNIIIKTEVVNSIFKSKKLSLPFSRNSDRLAIFSSSVRKFGRTANFSRGVSINIGFRKYIPRSYSVKNHVKSYEKEHKSLWSTDGYSFFVKNGILTSIEEEIRNVKNTKNM